MTDVLQFALLGLGTGAIFALLGQSIVAVNLGSGVLNLSAGALGMLGAYTFYGLESHGLIGGIGALLVALSVSGLAGVLTHFLIMRPLTGRSQMSQVVATLGLMAAILQVVTLLSSSNGATRSEPSPLPGGKLHFGSEIAVGVDRLVIVGIAIAVTLLLVLAQKRTRLGMATSAVAENRLVAATMGWSPDLVGAVAWGVGSAVAAAGAILYVALAGLSASNLTFLVMPALAAALIGRFRSFTGTLLGAMAIGVAQSEISRWVTSPGWDRAAPLLAIVLVLALRGTSLPARTDGVQRLPSVGTGRVRRAYLPVALIGTFLLSRIGTTWHDAFAGTFIFALIVLSLIVVMGYAGQVSLAQVAMAGLGGYLTAWIAIKTGMPLILAMFAGVALCSPIAVLVALPALRTRGYNLAIATLGLATAIDALVISNPARASVVEGKGLGSFSLFGHDLGAVLHPAAFTITTFVVFTLCALAVANLRRGRSGRRLLAVRSNERAAASLGISVAGVKLYAFWLAAMIAGVAGSLVQARFSTGDFTTFSLTENVNLVLVAVIGGVGWIAGALLGAQGVPGGVTARTLEVFISDPGKWLLLLGGVGAILAVMYAPNGLAEFEHRQWRWRRRIGTKLIGPLRRRIAARRGRRRRHPEGEPVAAPLAERVAVGRAPAATLEVCDVSVRFGVQDALCHAGLTVSTGEIVGLIGPNGAGKSTMIDVIAGFHRPTAGTVLLNGRAVDGLGPARRVRAGIGRSFQNLELFDDMTVLENLRVAADATSARHYLTDLVWPRAGRLTDAAVAAIDELELQPCLNRLPPELDYAKRRLVAIARTLSLAPSIVMLDEPAAGLDERERQEFARLLRRIAKDWGIGVLLIEHDVQMVFEVCERVIVLDRGTVIADGPAGEVRRSEAVIAAYIGQTDDEDPAPSEARAADGAVVA